MADYGRDFRGRRDLRDRWFGGYDAGYGSSGRRGYGGDYERPRTRGWFDPGHMVENAWGGAYARGDTEFIGRRLYGSDYRTGRRGHGGEYDREYRRKDPGYGWRLPFEGYDRSYNRGYDRGW